jgi:hypothetical protein
MSVRVAGSTAAMIFAFAAVFAVRASAATPEQIDSAIQKAKAYLYSKQKKGNWESHPTAPTEDEIKKSASSMNAGQWPEQTALATYALLAGGDGPQDDKLIEPIKFLQTNTIKGVYALALKTQIYPFLPPNVDRKRNASADAARLISGQFTQGPAKGLYDYLLNSKDYKRFDHSVSLYGLLGVWACQQAGAEVSSDYWKTVEDAWIRDQDPSGAWAFGHKPSARSGTSVAMTAAGLTALYITQDQLHADNGVLCKGNISNPHIDSGLAWLTKSFDKALTEKQRYSPYSTLFDVERVGMASGLKYFGSVDWYNVGTTYLMQNQAADGSWGGSIPTTCFAMLFLSHGQAPVVFNKLQYDVNGKVGNWNQRPRDAANIVDWISQKIERDLNWQIVSLQAPMPELHDAPILYLAGNESLQFTPEQEQKLQQFCEEGGIILGNADCGTEDFGNSFRALGGKLFPNDEFRELPPDHPIYTDQQWQRSQWKSPPKVLSLSNGVREMMVLLPISDPAKSWQLKEVTGREEAFQFADNLFLYAVGKENLKQKGRTYLVYPDEKIQPKRSITVARLQYDGNWDPEPAGWQRLAAILHNSCDINLNVIRVKLGTDKLGDGKANGLNVAHLTGTSKMKLDSAAQDEIRKFVEGGGTLMVDSAGGSEDFATSIEAQLGTIFGADVPYALKQLLPSTDPVFNLPGGAIKEIHFRAYTRKIGGLQGAQLKAIKVHDRRAVYYSREDLSAGLIGSPVDGILGYDPSTATAIMRNLVVLAGLGADAHVISEPPAKP